MHFNKGLKRKILREKIQFKTKSTVICSLFDKKSLNTKHRLQFLLKWPLNLLISTGEYFYTKKILAYSGVGNAFENSVI